MGPLLAARTALAADGALEAKPPQVRLVVDGEPGVRVERRQTVAEGWVLTIPLGYQRMETWEVSCVAPCDTVVDANSVFRINGVAVATSYDFTLPPHRDVVRMHLVPRSEVSHGVGVVLTVMGSLVAALGIAGIASVPVVDNPNQAANLRAGAWISLSVGLVALAVGIPMWILNHSFGRTDDGQTLGSARPLLAF